jgi:hypothetical protein
MPQKREHEATSTRHSQCCAPGIRELFKRRLRRHRPIRSTARLRFRNDGRGELHSSWNAGSPAHRRQEPTILRVDFTGVGNPTTQQMESGFFGLRVFTWNPSRRERMRLVANQTVNEIPHVAAAVRETSAGSTPSSCLRIRGRPTNISSRGRCWP